MRRLWILLLCLCALAAPAAGQEFILPSEADLAQMRRQNPDFTTFPDARGVIWLKEVSFAQAEGGTESTHLWVILGREGLGTRWLEWDLPAPAGGRTEVLGASLHAFETGAKLADVPALRSGESSTVRFAPPGDEPFLLVLAWREFRPDQLFLEGFAWTQEELPVWEVIVQARVPRGQEIASRAFPRPLRPTLEDEEQDRLYTWRRVNVDPVAGNGLALVERSGLAFAAHEGDAVLNRLLQEARASETEKPLQGVASKASGNRLSAIMDLKLNDQGMLSGRVRVLLRGAWGDFLLGDPWPEGEALTRLAEDLFPALQNYEELNLRSAGGVPELSFTLVEKPGVGGAGNGVLAIPPTFEPGAFRALEGISPPYALRFPFVLEQTLNISLPHAAQALVSGAVERAREAINYSESTRTRRNRLTAEARCALGVKKVSEEDLGRLRGCMEMWRNFSTRSLPVRLKVK